MPITINPTIAYHDLIDYAIRNGHRVSVWDGEEWALVRSRDRRAIVEAVRSVEEARLVFRDGAGACVGQALVAAYGLADDETVIDYGGPLPAAWDAEWTKRNPL